MQNNIDRLSGRNSHSNTLTGVQAEVLHQQETAYPVSKPAIDLWKIGEKLEFNDTREQTNGRRSEGIMTIGPGRKGPGAHAHTKQLEGFEVISGTMVAVVNGKDVIAHAGDTIIVQVNEDHSFKNGSTTEPLVAKFWYEPALNTEWMLHTLGADAMKNGGDWDKLSILPAMFVFYKMRHEYRLSGLPVWFQNIMFGFGAAIATWTGAAKKIQLPTNLK